MRSKQFGGKATKAEIAKYFNSKQWDGNKFLNLEETKMEFSFQKLPKFFRKQFCDKADREPNQALSILPFEKEIFLAPSDKMKAIWYGHSAILMRLNNKTILIDPMLGSNAAPISPIAVRRFSENTLQIIDDFPDIDLMLITHDHYDHLDFDSIKKLKSKTKLFYVALGVKRHLVEWGIEESNVIEFDWWQSQSFENIQITFTPTRHFSGRGLTDRAKSLWGGWTLKSDNENIWFSGDSGYGNHFKEIGKHLGPFDFSFMECGQYNENWHQIHMYPEESVQAAIDARVKKMMAVHWAGFALAQQNWFEPIVRFTDECIKNNSPYITPKLGEIFSLKEGINNLNWWKYYFALT